MPRVDEIDADGGGTEQSLGGRERRRQLLPLPFGQRVDQAPRHLLGPIVQPAPFAPTFRRQADDALTAVRRIPCDGHELVLLELSKQPAQVTGVEPEPAPQLAHARSAVADLEQQA